MFDIYPSRTNGTSAIIARQDPVVYGDGKYTHALTDDQLLSYKNNGFLVMENVFSDHEVNKLNDEVMRLIKSVSIINSQEVITEPNSKEVRSIFRVHSLSGIMAKLAGDTRLLNVARKILGSEVYIHQSRVNLKPGFNGKEFYWHSDFETWHVEDGMPRMRALSCSVLLTDNNSCNGPLMLVPGSHTQFISCVGKTPNENYKKSLKKQQYGVPDPISLKLLVDKGGIEAVTASAGSVIFFDCNTIHGSAGNISPWPRSNVFMVYNSIKNKLKKPKYGLMPRPEHIATRRNVKPVLAS